MKDSRRAKERARKKATKEAAMRAPKAKSPYAQKKAEQRNGSYRPTSPFYLPPSMREAR
jgi:hypothetical protein